MDYTVVGKYEKLELKVLTAKLFIVTDIIGRRN